MSFLGILRHSSPLLRASYAVNNPVHMLRSSCIATLVSSTSLVDVVQSTKQRYFHSSPSKILFSQKRPSDESSQHVQNRDEGKNEKFDKRIINVPNALTISRAAFTPLLGYWIVCGEYEYALAGTIVAGMSDFLDGYIARKFNQRSVLGSYIDPIADKIFISVLTISLAYQDLLSASLVALIVARDVGLISGGLYSRYVQLRNEPLRVRVTKFFSVNEVKPMNIEPLMSSKINTAAQLGLIGSSLCGAALPIPEHIVDYVVNGLSVIVGTTTVISGWGYMKMAKARV